MSSLAELIEQASNFSAEPVEPAATPPGRPALQLVGQGNKPSVPPAAWTYLGGRFELSERGARYVEEDEEGHSKETWLCSSIKVLALTRTAGSVEWGRLLEWQDDDGLPHRWAVPAAALQGDGVEVRKELAAGGLRIAPPARARGLLLALLQTAPVTARASCVDRLGWHNDTYLTADRAIGPHADSIVYQSEAMMHVDVSVRGSAEEWRESVARLAGGNSRLVLALSIAFAAPLLEPAGVEGGGVHFVGHSSTGKSTALRAAASVWGHPGRYLRTWRGTANGLEAICAQHNDGLLILDELHQCDPRELGEIVYMLGNGQGKARARRDGSARRAQSWRVLYLSSGEHKLDDRLMEIGKRSSAGQDVRLPAVPADAGCGMGIVKDLHGHANPRALVQALDAAAAATHGAVGARWLELLARDRERLLAELPAGIESYSRALVRERALGGQALRVARRFALIAAAGDLATAYGLTGWSKGEAAEAAAACFEAWLSSSGGEDQEKKRLLAQVRGFIERHGEARFEPIDSAGGLVVRDRAGFKRAVAGEPEWLVLGEVWRTEVVRGFVEDWAVRVLSESGWLKPGSDRPRVQIRTKSMGKIRAYLLTARAAGREPGETE